MSLHLYKSSAKLHGTIHLSSSKSESNRLLLMSALSEKPFDLKNVSDAKDTQTMLRLLNQEDKLWDVMEAGTTMRFCTAYLALKGQGHTITGTERMKQRPIGILVDALNELGCEIKYLENAGYPPLNINALRHQKRNAISVPGNISSQFISALLMIAPSLPAGLNLTLTEDIFSRPYIEMTLSLMQEFGISHVWSDNTISIKPQPYQSKEHTVESDWSGASYWYVMAAVAEEAELTLKGLKKQSLQGDSRIVEIMKSFGVTTDFEDNQLTIRKEEEFEKELSIDFKTCPDLAQGVMVAAALKRITLHMTGLETLKIKETDRIDAMRRELSKIGTQLIENADGTKWQLVPGNDDFEAPEIETYEDHRMAMAFGPLALRSDLTVKEPEVIKKSYPGYWEDLKSVGIEMSY